MLKNDFNFVSIYPPKMKRSWKRQSFLCQHESSMENAPSFIALFRCILSVVWLFSYQTGKEITPVTACSLVHNNSVTPLTPCCSNKTILSGIAGHDIFRQRFVETMKTPAADFVTSPQHTATWQQRKQKTVNKYDGEQPRLWLTPTDVFIIYTVRHLFFCTNDLSAMI